MSCLTLFEPPLIANCHDKRDFHAVWAKYHLQGVICFCDMCSPHHDIWMEDAAFEMVQWFTFLETEVIQ